MKDYKVLNIPVSQERKGHFLIITLIYNKTVWDFRKWKEYMGKLKFVVSVAKNILTKSWYI